VCSQHCPRGSSKSCRHIRECHCLVGACTYLTKLTSAVIFTRPSGACRGKLDSNQALIDWCTDLEAAVIETIESGAMTKDLAICVAGTTKVAPDSYQDTETFMNSVATTFAAKRSGKAKGA
jgi:isocitrate dehydrogenase